MLNVLLVGTGGFIGSGSRYLVGLLMARLIPNPVLPYGTLAANLLGCLLIGLLGGLGEARGAFSAEARLLIFLGFLGGFTTFSSFGYETLCLARDSQMSIAFLNVALQVVLGLAAVWGGHELSRVVCQGG